MIKLETVDYLRLCSLPRRTITVDLPAELVARKGNNRIARARCQAVQANLRDAVRAKFKQAVRRPFRSEVAIHLALFGLSLPEATPTIKALLDSLDGPVYPDDRAVALLDVVASPGALSATISVCSAREYTDALTFSLAPAAIIDPGAISIGARIMKPIRGPGTAKLWTEISGSRSPEKISPTLNPTPTATRPISGQG